ncbi:MAG: hypothetical protein ACKV2T_31065 [Kofleriaceae bacterium]
MRSPTLLVTMLTGCTFYVSSGSSPGDANGSADARVSPDAQLVDATEDSASPPLGDATIDSLFPPFDVMIPPFDAFIPPDIVIPPFDTFVPPDIVIPPLPDGAMDAGTPGWNVIETISVPCSGQVMVSQTLGAGVPYRVRASGLCKIGEFFGSDILADAEFQGTVFPRDTDNGIDTGIAINDATLGSNKFPTWGNYTSTHVYEIGGPGQGAPITLRYHDNGNNAYGNNSGALTIQILAQ